MFIWEDVTSSSARAWWDNALLESQDYNIFQSFAWGEYKSKAGWSPWRICVRNAHGKIAGMVQILMKTLPANIQIGWAPGGPVSAFPASDHLEEFIQSLVARLRQVRTRCYYRFDSYRLLDEERTAVFAKFLRPAAIRINSPFSVYLDLQQPIDSLMKSASRHHRRDLAKALRADVEWKLDATGALASELAQLHGIMRKDKKLRTASVDVMDIFALCQEFNGSAVIVTGFVKGEPVSSCLSLIVGTKAVYSIGAANREGRRIFASYAMLYRLLEYLRSRGVTEFDFGGINPKSSSAAGVNYFKTGFGGRLVERMGEWEAPSSAAVRWLFNLSVASRNLMQ